MQKIELFSSVTDSQRMIPHRVSTLDRKPHLVLCNMTLNLRKATQWICTYAKPKWNTVDKNKLILKRGVLLITEDENEETISPLLNTHKLV